MPLRVAGHLGRPPLSLDCMVSQTLTPPAPVDPAGLAESLRPFGQSRMLPRAAYVDREVFGWEQRHFFGGGWVCVGRSEQLRNPGDQRAEAVGTSSVLLVRGEDATLRAFAGFKNRPGFEAGQWGLIELPVTEWHGLIFVDGSGAAAPLADSLATLAELVAPYEMDRLVLAGQHDYDAAANWKILSENYHECYHCPAIHPELCKVSPPKSGENYAAAGTWVGGWMDLRDGMATMSLDGRSYGVALRGLDAAGLRTVIYVHIFPNVLVSLHPDYVMVHRLVPLAADRTRIECTWAFAPESLEQPGFDPGYAIEFWDITNRQDWHACESVQRGLSSPHAVPGPLSPDEDAVYQFVTMVARGYRGQPVWNPGGVASVS